jgi:lipopolysaccharide export system permease protein
LLISRYLTKEILTTWIAVTTVLFLIFFSNRFMRYLADAASGAISNEAVFQLVAIKSLTSLPVLLPLALYLAVLVAMGRLYKDSEMTALAACGIGVGSVLKTVVWIATPISLLLLGLALYAVPSAQKWAAEIQTEARASADFSAIVPGRFKTSRDDGLVLYTENVVDNGQRLERVFARHIQGENVSVLSSEGAFHSYSAAQDILFIVFNSGFRYEGAPGATNFKIIEFDEYGVKVQQAEAIAKHLPLSATPTSQLLESENLREIAELQWRMAMPLSAVLLALLSVLLSRSDPRQGRFAKLFVAILIYVVYNNLMGIAKNWVELGQSPASLGIWWVHMLLAALILYLWMKQVGLKWTLQRIGINYPTRVAG